MFKRPVILMCEDCVDETDKELGYVKRWSPEIVNVMVFPTSGVCAVCGEYTPDIKPWEVPDA